MAQQNIYNPQTKQFGYQVEGAALPTGWISVGSGGQAPAPAPATNPAPAPASAPTPTDTGVRRYTGTTILGESPADKAAKDYYSTAPRTAPDEATIRANALAAVQGQIDNVRTTYAGMLAAEKTRGESRLGSTRSVNARAGLLGSNFGTANTAKTEDINAQNEDLIRAQEAAKVDEILNGVNKDVQDRLKMQTDQVNKNTEGYITYLQQLGDRAKDQIKQLSSSGFTIDQLTDQEYNHLLDATGYTPEQLKAQFTLNAPQASVLHSEVDGNKYIQVIKDPATGKTSVQTIDLGFDVPKDYKVQKLDNGQLVFYPDKIDPNKPFSQQVMTYGAATDGGTKQLTSGSLKYTSNDVAQGATILNQSKGEDGYVDPNLYNKMYNTWVSGGGLPQDFTKNYPPAVYINPANTDLPQYLRSKNQFDTGGGA